VCGAKIATPKTPWYWFIFIYNFFFWGGGGQWPPCGSPPPRPSIFPIIVFLSATLLTGMTGISLNCLWLLSRMAEHLGFYCVAKLNRRMHLSTPTPNLEIIVLFSTALFLTEVYLRFIRVLYIVICNLVNCNLFALLVGMWNRVSEIDVKEYA
jgi:hypothetical protein